MTCKRPQIKLSLCFTLIVFSGGGLSDLEIWIFMNFHEFSSFLWVWKHPWSKVNRCHVLFSSFYFALMSFHEHSFPSILDSFFLFLSFSFHFAFMSFHVPSLCMKHTGLRKVICSNRSGRYPPKCSRFFFICRYRSSYRFAILLEACAGCHVQGSWTCTCISLLSLFLLLPFSEPVVHW